jgi:hypothetical protein
MQSTAFGLGTGTERFDAHRLYYNHGLAIYSHHFARGL